ncbi:PREDICTED: paternally-expressed gene 3 protein [Condylura cristata]|uniref:paternally-expressed gene 3 protein n=1 Tax=Condylura cristata TaxID=143302 RepID=UPI000642DF39|nr:PREDICTED: paternally-expressed gene 3 protein [Condylura cristata]
MTRKAAGSPPPHSAPGDQDQDWGCERERGRDRRGRSRDPAPQAGWAHPGHPRGRPPQRDPSPPALETPAPTPGREHRRRGPGPPSQDGDAVSYQEVVALAGDRKPQNPIQDNMENYRKLLSLGVQLAENDGHSHLTHGHPSRSRRGAHPSTSRGVKAAPEARKPAHRRGICEDESSHGVIMEKFLKDVSRSPRPGRARECGGRPLGPPRWPDQGRKGLPPPQREPRPQARGSGRHALAGGGFPSHCSLAPQRRVLERKRRYHLDPDAKGPGQEQGGCARKRPTVGGEPGQLRRQKARSREGLYGLQDGGDAFRPRPDLGEPLKTPAWKNLYGGRGRGREQAGGQGGPCADSQRSHTITRPPEDGEDQRAFATGASPAGARVAPAKEAKCEEEPRALSVIHSPSAGAQRSRGAGAPGRLNVTAGPSSQSAAAAPRDGRPGGERERPGILRPAALQGPRTHGGAGPIAQGGEKAGACACPSEVSGKRQDSRCAESPPRGSAGDGRTGGVARSLSPLQPREGLVGETGELKKDSASPAPSPQGLGHQKARAKRKNIEQGGPGACGSPSPRPRERAHECRVCGVSFALSAELAEHQKVHGRKCTVGETRGPSVICSLASASPQMSHVPRLAQARDPGPAVQANSPTEPARAGPTEQLAPRECRERGVHFTTLEGPGAHQKVYGGEQVHGGGLLGASVQGTGREGALQEEQPPQVELGEPHGDGDGDEDDDAIYGCGDCGLGFADRADLKDHQKVHSRVYPADARTPPRTVARLPRVSEYQQDLTGEQLYECPACGESFVHSAFLFEHQKIHEQDQFYGFRRLDEPFLRPLILGPRRPRAPQKVPRALTPLHCQVCGQDFIHASLLVEHMQAHPRARLPALGQPSEDTTGPSLALAELQRSQAEEKQHECETCGAAFLSRAALREHLHVHRRGQPYAYGASFVHASFLTEPPKRDMPFFECKDCGETFVHNTVLLRHQKLHLEEEDAAVSQEAEANVLVPREVLCIQGSSVEAAEPEVEAAEPAGEARGPGGEAEQPHDGDADEPDGAGILDPEERAEEPEGDADEPDGAGVHDPEEAGGAQEAQGDGPSCGQPEGTLLPLPACGQRLPAHAGVIMFEPARVSGEGSRCRASTSSGDGGGAGSGRFRCPICGQLFRDRLSLARHQDAHTG